MSTTVPPAGTGLLEALEGPESAFLEYLLTVACRESGDGQIALETLCELIPIIGYRLAVVSSMK